MKRKIIVGALMLVLALALAGCGEKCDHNWRQADCENGRTCQLCGKTKGEALGHSWKAATCASPKTCETCGVTEGGIRGHSWKDATCQDPKICTTCGTTEGELGGHTWKDGNCMSAKTCTTCGITEGGLGDHEMEDATCEAPQTCIHCGWTVGEALGHDWGELDCQKPKSCITCGWSEETDPEAPEPTYPDHVWVDATCEEPKHCANCDQTEGEALGHDWEKSGNYQTCSVCGAVDGGASDVDSRFQTEQCKPLFGSWKGEVTITAKDLGMTDYEGSMTEIRHITFNPDGTAKMVVTIKNMDDYVDLMTEYMFQRFASMEMDREQAEQATMAQYGMTVREYAAMNCEKNSNVITQCVYYVNNGKLYTGAGWNAKMTGVEITIEDDTIDMYDTDLKRDVRFEQV